MSQALTESFCERCGTRYEFKAPSRVSPLRRTRGVVSGLRHFVMSQDPLGESLDSALRREEERLAVAQYDAFHASFAFCFGCRQYACVSCWNDGAGRCLSCAPLAVEVDPLEAAGLHPVPAAALTSSAGPAAWPTSDLRAAAAPTDAQAARDWPIEEALGSSEVAAFEAAAPAPPAADDDAESEPLFQLELVTEANTAAEPHAEPGATDAQPEPEPMQAMAEPELESLEAEPVPLFELEPVVEAGGSAEAQGELDATVAQLEREPMQATAEPEPGSVEAEPVPLFELEPAGGGGAPAESQVEPAATQSEPVLLEAPRLRVLAWDDDAPLGTIETDVPEHEPSPTVQQAAEDEQRPTLTELEAPVAELEVPMAEVPVAEAPVAGVPVAEVPAAEVPAADVPEPEAPVAEPEPEPLVPQVDAAAEDAARTPDRPTEPALVTPIERVPVAPTTPAPLAEERIAAVRQDPELAARRAQLDLLGLSDPGEGAVAPAAPNVLPYRSREVAASAGDEARLAARGASIWEVSARLVADAGAGSGVRSCGGCGLSLSANARFCRRCGTQQARPA